MFTTPDGTKSGLKSQIDLALPPNGSVADGLLEIDTRTLNQMASKFLRQLPCVGTSTCRAAVKKIIFDTMVPPEAIRRVRDDE
jgi:hypothetical protein